MYKSSAYYIATTVASIMTFLFYPILVSLVSFWMLGLDDSSFAAFLDWTLILSLTASCGFSFGLMMGTFISNENAAIQTNLLFGMIFSFGGGMYANTGEGSSLLVRAISWVSPMRYSSELLMRRVIFEKPGNEYVLEYLGFTWGKSTCYTGLVLFTVICFFTGWLSMLIRYRNV